MTTLQKAIVAAAVAAALGTGIYQARQLSIRRAEVQTLQQQQTPLTKQIQQLQRESDEARSRLASAEQANQRLRADHHMAELLKARGEVARWRSAVNDPDAAMVRASLEKVDRLKQRLEQTPNARIPEFQFLTDEDWRNAAEGNLNTDDDYRRALAALRNAAENAFGPKLQLALRGYLQANYGESPTNAAQLRPFFKSPVDEAILQRWQIVPGEDYGTSFKALITQKAAVDEEYDLRSIIAPDADSIIGFKKNSTPK
jgi:hypothetical protein